MIDCREAVRRMWAYLDHELDEKPVSEFEAHLDACQRCCGELEFSRHLREMVVHHDVMPPLSPRIRSRIELLLSAGPDQNGGDP